MDEMVEFKYAPSEQEVVFAEVLARTLDPARAWVDAGFENFGPVKNFKRASSLAKTNKIKERMEYLKALVATKANLTDVSIITNFKELADSNMADFIDMESGEIKDFRDIPREVMAAVKKIKVIQTEFGVVREITLYDKAQSNDKLAKMLNLYERNNQREAPRIIFNMGKKDTVEIIEVD